MAQAVVMRRKRNFTGKKPDDSDTVHSHGGGERLAEQK